MNEKDAIIEFYNNLVLKQAFLGYNKNAVLESYKKLDAIYREQHQKEKAEQDEQISSLTDKVRSLESRLAELDNQKKQLTEENTSLKDEVESLKQGDDEKKAYHDKADMLSRAMLQFEQEKAEQEKKLEYRSQAIIEQANAEARDLSVKYQMDYAEKVKIAISEIEALKNRKKSIVEQLRQLELLIAQQVKIFSVEQTEE